MYFNLLSRGYAGYKDVMEQNLKNARLLSRALELSGYYEVLSEIHHPIGGKLKEADEHVAEEFEPGLPVIAFRWTDELKAKNPHLQQKWVQHLLRAKGWICPNYELAPDCEKTEILRVVVREQASEDFIDQLVHDVSARRAAREMPLGADFPLLCPARSSLSPRTCWTAARRRRTWRCWRTRSPSTRSRHRATLAAERTSIATTTCARPRRSHRAAPATRARATPSSAEAQCSSPCSLATRARTRL